MFVFQDLSGVTRRKKKEVEHHQPYGGLEGTSTFFFIRDFFFYRRLFFFIRDFFFYRRLFFFYRRLFFLSATFFYRRLFSLIRAVSSAVFFLPCAVCVKTAGSRTLKSRPAGNMAAAMAGEDREEKEQDSIRKVNMLSYFWYQFTGKKVSKHLMSNQLERYTQYI